MSYNASDWKRGDVVAVGSLVGLWDDSNRRRGVQWSDGSFSAQFDLSADVRRLVVIDPESDDVERLADIFCKAPSSGWVHDMQAALREFANPKPPKPAEPTGLGAVVRDASGDRWVWMSAGAPGPHWHRVGVGVAQMHYRDIDAVEVLSEGVTP